MSYKFPSVTVDKPKRANYKLSHAVRATMAPGVIYPVLTKELLPGDSFDIKVNTLIQTMATLSPVLGSLKVRFDFFTEDLANLYGFMDNNTSDGGNKVLEGNRHRMVVGPFTAGFKLSEDGSVKLRNSVGCAFVDLTSIDEDLNSEYAPKTPYFGVAPGSLLNWLGLPVGYVSEAISSSDLFDEDVSVSSFEPVCADRLLTYYDIIRNYYINEQDSLIPIFTSGYNIPISLVRNFSSVSQSKLDDFFMWLRQQPDGVLFDSINYETQFEQFEFGYFLCRYLLRNEIRPVPFYGVANLGLSTVGCGLAAAQFGADYFTSLLNYQGVLDRKVYIDVENNKFSVDSTIWANQLQALANRLGLSGGRFGDFMYSLWGTSNRRHMDIPEYHGSHYMSVDFQDVVATASSDVHGRVINQGDQTARGEGYTNSGNFHIKVKNHSILMVMCTIVPRVDYYQGVDKELQKTSFADLFNPLLSRLPFQPVNREQLFSQSLYVRKDVAPGDNMVNFFDSSEYSNYLVLPYGSRRVNVGMLPAWAEYQTCENRLVGQLSTSLRYWSFARNVAVMNYHLGNPYSDEAGEFCYEYSTYVAPQMFNYIFADTDESAENYIVQLGFDIFSKRPVGNTLPPKY